MNTIKMTPTLAASPPATSPSVTARQCVVYHVEDISHWMGGVNRITLTETILRRLMEYLPDDPVANALRKIATRKARSFESQRADMRQAHPGRVLRDRVAV